MSARVVAEKTADSSSDSSELGRHRVPYKGLLPLSSRIISFNLNITMYYTVLW